ncbi:peptidoglycan recognition protein family protein [Streptomyces sp. BH105]|uniref:peptidoglycan recognition protein family protein n=1 Tax=Streptomyces sp. BH105 TaxID=3410408 RepID=UPI003CFACD5C
MARMPGATYRAVVNVHKNGCKERRGLVLHVQAGNNSPYGWFNNSASQASSDFWVSKTGKIEQYVNTGTDYAWAQGSGNAYYASVETEGFPGEKLTDAQIQGVAKIYAWGHKEFGWPLKVVNSTTAKGLTYHGAGGSAWGGHTGCPGDLRKAQRSAIIAAATKLAGGTASTATPTTSKYTPPAFPKGLAPNHSSPSAKTLQKALKATDWLAESVTLADNYGPLTQKAVAGFNKKHGLNDAGKTYDPAIGPRGWALLFTLAYG